MDETTIDRAAMERLAKALVFICRADHPTTIALQAAAESGSRARHQECPRAVPEVEAERPSGSVDDA